jgi:hypothetical protein
MTLYVVLAAILVYSWKFLGHFLPQREGSKKMQPLTDAITIGLLASLVAIQGFTLENQVVLDARLPALLLAAVLLWRKVPFIVVVVCAAALAAAIRFLS